MEPLVSIGLRVHNGEPHLNEAIDSLLNQSYRNIELIISDNASADRTEEICRQYARYDKRVNYIRQETNIGPLRNFDFVLKKSSGDFFMWASYDDTWDRRFIQAILEVLRTDPWLALVQAETQYMLEDGTPLPFFPEGKFFYNPPKVTNPKKIFSDIIRAGYGNLIYGIYKKKYLYTDEKQKISILENMKAEVLNEIPFYLHLALNKGSIKVIPEILMRKRTIVNTFFAASLESRAGISEKQLSELVPKKEFSTKTYLYNLLGQIKSYRYHKHALRDIIQVIKYSNFSKTIHFVMKLNASMLLTGHYIKLIYWAAIWKLKPLV